MPFETHRFALKIKALKSKGGGDRTIKRVALKL